MKPDPEHLVVGHVSKAHGTRGAVVVWPLTDHPERIFAPGREVLLADEAGEVGSGAAVRVVAGSRPYKKGWLIRFEGCEDRDGAELLTRRYLAVTLDSVAPLAEGEMHYHQLLGAEVVTVDDEVVGTVREVFETSPAHLLEVEATGGKRHLVPFVEQVVRRVSREDRRIVIDPPAGLLDL